jgi:hypothetical protein
MHTPRHRPEIVGLPQGINDYKETTCNHSTSPLATLTELGRMVNACNECPGRVSEILIQAGFRSIVTPCVRVAFSPQSDVL